MTTTCKCGTGMVDVETNLRDCTLRMVSCPTCGERSWTRDGHPIDLVEVLDVVRHRRHRIMSRRSRSQLSER